MKIAVGVATTGRREVLSETLTRIALQTRKPDQLLVCHVKPEDVDLEIISDLPFEAAALESSPGLTVQRNRILGELRKFDLVVFFDDDFFPAPDYLERVEELFSLQKNAVMLTGHVLADGARGAGISPNVADQILIASDSDQPPRAPPRLVFSAYGCNMAIRLYPVFLNGLKFEEELPLYGWLEDMAFTRRIAKHGRVLWVPQMRGVHLAIKSSRNSGLRFGYAQIANPVYLWRRELVPWRILLSHAGKNLLSNLIFRSDQHVDRKGRLLGNLIALRDLVLRRLQPDRILDL